MLKSLRIAELLERAEGLAAVSPTDKAPEGAELLGELPNDIKQLYALREDQSQRAELIVEEIKTLPQDEVPSGDLALKARSLHAEISLIRSLYWNEIYVAFGLYANSSKPKVAICEGWQVYSVPQDAAQVCDVIVIGLL